MLRTFAAVLGLIACLMMSCQALCDVTQPQVASIAPSSSAAKVTGSAKPSEPGKPYTALVIDATGLELKRDMSPKIRRIDGMELWGTCNADCDFVIKYGIVAYASSLEDAKAKSRAGSNPLVVKAAGVAENKVDPLLCDWDSIILLFEEQKSGFLDKFNVVFVVDDAIEVSENVDLAQAK